MNEKDIQATKKFFIREALFSFAVDLGPIAVRLIKNGQIEKMANELMELLDKTDNYGKTHKDP